MSRQSEIAPEVKRLRSTGMTWKAIAKHLRASIETVRMAADPVYAENRRIANRLRKRKMRPPKRIRMADPRPTGPDAHRAIKLAAERARHDHRTPFQRAFGDPPFERSALYQKMQGKP